MLEMLQRLVVFSIEMFVGGFAIYYGMKLGERFEKFMVLRNLRIQTAKMRRAEIHDKYYSTHDHDREIVELLFPASAKRKPNR